MSRWFRFYDDAVNDPKLLRLSDPMFRAWTMLLCIASKNDGTLPSAADIALMLRVKPTKIAEWLAVLTAGGLIDNNDGVFSPHNWNARQFKSDVSTERVKRFRKQERNVSETVSETPPETEQKQITETDQSREKRAQRRGARLPDEWKPSAEDANEAMRKLGGPLPAEQELLKFRDYWKAQPGQRGTKLDWDATWRNWIRNAKGSQNGRRTVHDAAKDLTRTLERIAEFDEPAPGGLRLEAGGTSVRLLPPR